MAGDRSWSIVFGESLIRSTNASASRDNRDDGFGQVYKHQESEMRQDVNGSHGSWGSLAVVVVHVVDSTNRPFGNNSMAICCNIGRYVSGCAGDINAASRSFCTFRYQDCTSSLWWWFVSRIVIVNAVSTFRWIRTLPNVVALGRR